MEKSKESLRVELGLDAALQLQKISTSLIPEGNIDILFGDVLDAAISLMSADMGSMQVFMPQRDELRLLGSRLIKPTMPGRQRDTRKRDNCVPVCHSGLRHV